MVKTEGNKKSPSASKGTKRQDLDKKIRSTIGWYNRHAKLQDQIQYNKVAPLMSQLPPTKVGGILASLEGKEEEIKNPTAWLAAAAKKYGASAGAAASSGGDIKKIGKTIGWYNKQGNLQDEIQYNQIAPLMAQLPSKKAGAILAQLEGKEADIKNPTKWLATAALRAIGDGVGGEVDKRIGKVIHWYNKQGKLKDEIQYNKVAPLLSQLSPGKALKILDELEGKEETINDPTAWLCGAARKAGAGSW